MTVCCWDSFRTNIGIFALYVHSPENQKKNKLHFILVTIKISIKSIEKYFDVFLILIHGSLPNFIGDLLKTCTLQDLYISELSTTILKAQIQGFLGEQSSSFCP